MKKQLLLLLLVLMLGLGGCKKGSGTGGNQAAPTGSSFILGVDCQCEGVRRIDYSYYAGEERRGCGGTMTLDEDLRDDWNLSFGPSQFREEGDLGSFAIAFSLYGADGKTQLGSTNRVTFPARYGEGYSVRLSGDQENGFAAQLVE